LPIFDIPLEALKCYLPERSEPNDFRAFWADTLAATREHPLDPMVTPDDVDLPLVEVYDLSFAGFDGQRVRGWYLRPRHCNGPLPCVVHFLGYGDGRGTPLEWLTWPAAGYALIVMDTRGQGARARRAGATGDSWGSESPHVEGFLTQGILDPADYYYRRVFTDAVRAVEVAHTLEGIDRSRVAVEGTSQGGGIALAAAALADGLSAAMLNVPFLCHFTRAIEMTDRAPYAELLSFLRSQRDLADRALETLRYFDGMNMAASSTVPSLFSVALMDPICPPSTVFAAYNHYAGAKEIDVFPYNEHEGGGVHQDARQIRWLRDHWS
jgi:cephalosporin-C deacetylase